ncbi:glycosyltransferase [Aureimonas leprariae]|nr:glycosyltransferase [Aureimonas leprariae]
MDLVAAWRTLALGDADRHADALVLAATRALRGGRPAEAFEFIDRRCRIARPPRAVDLAIRALASALCGFPAEAERDLARAESADPLDPMVAMTRLRLGADAPTLRRLAGDIANGGRPVAPSLLQAVLKQFVAVANEDGAPRALAGLDVLDGRLSGFAAWPAGLPVALEIGAADGTERFPLRHDPALAFAPDGFDACRLDARLEIVPESYRLLAEDGAVLADGRIWPRRSRLPATAARRRAPERVPPRASVTVVVPVYRGFEATRDCFAALFAEAERHADLRIVAVDDASPEPAVAGLLDAHAANGRIALRRNGTNLGFAGAVGRGLEGERGRDILLLNADAVLPAGAVARLAAAVYSAPAIGTATPFSNNGEYASLPRHAAASPAPTPEAAVRIDAAAARIGGGTVVDLPTGTGFCLFVRHDCMAAVGGLPLVYGRGYFEDMEFCLGARRAGFRNVCATSVYVVHRGSESFGAAKRGLAVRNLAILRQRFPGIEAECAAYAEADPLASARAALIAAAGDAFPPEPPPEAPAPLADPPPGSRARPPTLGVLVPDPAPALDAFLARLSAALRLVAPAARIVVIGRAADDLALMGRGNVFVTGPLAEGEHRSVALRYGVRALLVPPLPAPDPSLPVLTFACPERVGAPFPDIPAHAVDPAAAHAIAAEFARRIEAPAPG